MPSDPGGTSEPGRAPSTQGRRPGDGPGARARRACGLGVRLGLMGAVAVMGWRTLGAYFEMFAGPRREAPPRADAAAALPEPEMLLALLRPGGAWSLAGAPWRCRAASLSHSELASFLHAPPPAGPPPGPGPSAEERSLLAKLDRLAPRKTAG